ncbi:c-type cytochrome [Chitinophagaceae bacterium LB-8]|uniref:C-type cytochrome n=1 Tax=Paraflavisolibacter caeni TaxID=2982496 RepID=A0A9X2XUY6_9BACT|nr:c-type cytochrome [Paraflavisolibacter caeni]MCU7549566.1 c-type cytochrome [Paraflavisolibacter caeni]
MRKKIWYILTIACSIACCVLLMDACKKGDIMVSLVSANSKYDQVKRGQALFTKSEQAGYNTFKAKCASCHQEPLFTDLSYRNNGLKFNDYLKDVGRMRITQKKEDSLKFKVPSLRNVALTNPYMHDGRFWTLPDVLKHYTSGIQQSTTLDPVLAGGISLSAEEKNNLISFLETLTDDEFVNDPRFEQPQ